MSGAFELAKAFAARECRHFAQEAISEIRLADDFLFQRERAGAARGPLYAIAKLTDVDLELGDSAAERIAVHAQLARGAALVAFVLLQYGEDETFLELADTFRIKNIAAIHLQNEGF
jgi:hypothetical protein